MFNLQEIVSDLAKSENQCFRQLVAAMRGGPKNPKPLRLSTTQFRHICCHLANLPLVTVDNGQFVELPRDDHGIQTSKASTLASIRKAIDEQGWAPEKFLGRAVRGRKATAMDLADFGSMLDGIIADDSADDSADVIEGEVIG